MKVKVDSIKANPYRHIEKYPISRSKVDSLKVSIEQTEFWDNVLLRKAGDNFELAYGHHRLKAIQELGIKEIDVPVKNISDSDMIRIMANENMDEWASNPGVINETVSAAKEFIDSELMRKDPDESIRILFESEHAMNQASTHGAGREAILKFLGGNWKGWMIQDALKIINDDKIDRSAVETMPSFTAAKSFSAAVKRAKVPVEEQKIIADDIIKSAKESNDSISRRSVSDAVGFHIKKKNNKIELDTQVGAGAPEDKDVELLFKKIKIANRSCKDTSGTVQHLVDLADTMAVIDFHSLDGMELQETVKILVKALSALGKYIGFDIKEVVEL